jgi:hypothetical protein
MVFKYQFGARVSSKEYFAEVLRDSWDPYGPRNVYEFEERIMNSGDDIVAAFWDGKTCDNTRGDIA